MPPIRIGDADREAAAASLSEHFTAGRLDHDELEERLATAWAAKTGDELVPLFADLPGGAPGRALTPVAPRAALVWPVPFRALLVVFLVVTTIGALSNGYPPVPLIVAFVLWRVRRFAMGRPTRRPRSSLL